MELSPHEHRERNEEKLIDKLIPLLEALIEKSYLTGTTYRDTHAKGHAAVRATFTVEAHLPPELKVGLFAKPQTYPAWVRLSNLNPVPQDDKKKDIRALGIKLMEVGGDRLWQSEPGDRTLDFIMMGSQTFLAPNLQQFYELERALLKGGASVLRFFGFHPWIMKTIVNGQQKTANLLRIPYWSQTAYAFGDRVVQYHMEPHETKSKLPNKPTPNFLRERLKEDLGSGPASFDFMVQFQIDPKRKMPVEDPMVAWNPKRSPYRKVATLTLLQQTFDSPAQVEFCENLSFNPWRTLPEHRPLGAINRARLQIYPAIAEFRHRRNNAPVWREPTPEDPTFGPER
jgi:hypothetical protein